MVRPVLVEFKGHGGRAVPVLLDPVRQRQNFVPHEICVIFIHTENGPIGVPEIGAERADVVAPGGKAAVLSDLLIILDGAEDTRNVERLVTLGFRRRGNLHALDLVKNLFFQGGETGEDILAVFLVGAEGANEAYALVRVQIDRVVLGDVLVFGVSGVGKRFRRIPEDESEIVFCVLLCRDLVAQGVAALRDELKDLDLPADSIQHDPLRPSDHLDGLIGERVEFDAVHEDVEITLPKITPRVVADRVVGDPAVTVEADAQIVCADVVDRLFPELASDDDLPVVKTRFHSVLPFLFQAFFSRYSVSNGLSLIDLVETRVLNIMRFSSMR